MKYYGANYKIDIKEDQSAVTAADIIANNFIVESLNKLNLGYIVIAEENKPELNIIQSPNDTFWLIDPIDGTNSFIEEKDTFTVNIALIKNRQPVFGVIYVPVTENIYYNDGNKAYKRNKNGEQSQIYCQELNHNKLDILVSSGNDPGIVELKKLSIINSITKIGSSLKIAMLSEGKGHAYPRYGTTMEWDTAAGHAILKAAGGDIVDYNDQPIIYGKQTFKNPSFIAYGKRCNKL